MCGCWVTRRPVCVHGAPTGRSPQVALRCDALTLNDVLQWPVVFQPLFEPISGPIALCALLEATLTGIPLTIPSAFESEGRVTLALRQTIRGLPLCNDAGSSALVPRFEDITTTGSPVKCGFNCGFPHRPQKKWKLNYSQKKEAQESGSCSKTFNASHGTTYDSIWVAWATKSYNFIETIEKHMMLLCVFFNNGPTQ